MNRTKIGLLTSGIAIASALVLGVLMLVRIRVILDSYGTDLNAIMQVAVQLSAYLVLLESGMSAAYQYRMYGRIHEKDEVAVLRLYRGLSINMRQIAVRMIVVFAAVALLYAGLVRGDSLPYLDASLVLLVMGVRFIAPFLLTLPQRTLLATYERKYIADIVQTSTDVAIIVLEIVIAFTLHPPLYVLLLIALLGTVVTVPIYNRMVSRYLKVKLDKAAQAEPDMEPKGMTKDIVVHQVSGLVFSNTDNVLLSIFHSLNSVTIYSAFNTLMNFPIQLQNRVIVGLRASLAMKITGGDRNSYAVYNEMLTFAMFCSALIAPLFIVYANPFAKLWIGPSYMLGSLDIILLAAIIVHRMIMPVVYAARDSRGLYKETKNSTIMQAAANLAISLALIGPLGITGVLIGTVASTFFILQPFNFIAVYRKVFETGLLIYKQLAALALHVACAVLACRFLCDRLLREIGTDSWWTLAVTAATSGAMVLVLAAAAFWLFSASFRAFAARVLRTVMPARLRGRRSAGAERVPGG